MKRPVLTVLAVAPSLLAAPALAQTTRDYAAIYGARSGASAQLSPQQDVTTTVGTGPATRYAKPQPGSEARGAPRPLPRGTGRDYGYTDYGTVSGGYPAYGSREFPEGPASEQAEAAEPAEDAAEPETQAEQAEAQQEGEGEFAVSEGFFFDNYTSGTGFGVYGGEAVSSGSGSPLILPSAGNRSQELGFPTGPGTGGNGADEETPDAED